MFERPKTGERALLVHCFIGAPPSLPDAEEFALLADSAGAEVLCQVEARLARAQPRYLLGSGKVDELVALVQEHCIDVVLMGAALTPSQERNLEKRLKCRVLDRSGLILDIFAQRARSFEGKLQVELAQLRHLSTRLVRGWTHLERQKGGIGLRGPGESQLETDRRLIDNRIDKLRGRLVKVDSQRNLGRSARSKREVPVIALVGYTNAGKSTLFNRLTKANVYAANKLFATLDPTLRQLKLNDGSSVVLADTVGFVRDLPHELVAAFRSTLTETREAALILHVIDASDPHRKIRVDDVNNVLEGLGAEAIRQIRVYNKIDAAERSVRVERGDDGEVCSVWLSAMTGDGIDELLVALAEICGQERVQGEMTLGPEQGRLRARLFQLDAIRNETILESGGWCVSLDMPLRQYQKFCASEDLAPVLANTAAPSSLDEVTQFERMDD